MTSTTESESDQTQSAFAQDPRVAQLTEGERTDYENLVVELGDWLHRKHGRRDTDVHKSAGAHRRAVYFAGPNLVREAMRLLDDRIDAGRAGRKDWVRDPSAAFWGILRNLAAEKGVSLDPAGERPAERKNEALAGSVEVPAAVPEPTKRSVGGTLGPDTAVEDRSPEARARIYANHLFPFRYRNDHGRDPSPEEIEQTYQQRLEHYRAAAADKESSSPSRRR